jgi:hypothetical protein
MFGMSVSEQMDIVTNYQLQLLVRFVLSSALLYRSPPFLILPRLFKMEPGESSTFVREDILGKIITRATTTN